MIRYLILSFSFGSFPGLPVCSRSRFSIPGTRGSFRGWLGTNLNPQTNHLFCFILLTHFSGLLLYSARLGSVTHLLMTTVKFSMYTPEGLVFSASPPPTTI